MSLRIHHISLNAVKSVAPIIARVQRRDAKLADQMRRAAQSVHLNIAEAEGLSDGNQRTRFGTARGSARDLRFATCPARISLCDMLCLLP